MAYIHLKELDQEAINIMESLSIMLAKIQTLYEQSKENEQVNDAEGVVVIGMSAQGIESVANIIHGLLHTYRWLVLSNMYPQSDPPLSKVSLSKVPPRAEELHELITKRAADWLQTIVKEK